MSVQLPAFFAHGRQSRLGHLKIDPPLVRLFEVVTIFRNVALTYAIFATNGSSKGLIILILEAFAQYLQAADEKTPATDVLARWLWERLSTPPETTVDRVLHCEVKIALQRKASSGAPAHGDELDQFYIKQKSSYVFRGASSSGSKLLKTLYEYCLSYEQQKWARWVHSLKASDFNICN